MNEREQHSEHEQFSKTLREQAKTSDGLRLTLKPGETLRLSLSGSGEVVLALEAQTSAEERGQTELAGSASVPADPAEARSKEQEPRRRTVQGIIASVPRYGPLPRKGLRVGFVLAEHREDGTTQFYRVYATGDYARRVQAKSLSKRDRVTVEGELQHNLRRQGDAWKPVEELYCYGLRLQTAPRHSARAAPPGTTGRKPQ
jgi:hypothetical protein